MTDYKGSDAVFALNSYIWKLLEANLSFSRDDYGGGMPIIPVQQQPELLQYSKPFLVFGSVIHPFTHLFELQTEAVSYVIYGTSVSQVNNIVNLLVDTFKRQDIAAADVNEWLDTEAQHRAPRGVSFSSVSITIGEKAMPATEEGGNYSALVMLEMKYTLLDSNIQTRGFTY